MKQNPLVGLLVPEEELTKFRSDQKKKNKFSLEFLVQLYLNDFIVV